MIVRKHLLSLSSEISTFDKAIADAKVEAAEARERAVQFESDLKKSKEEAKHLAAVRDELEIAIEKERRKYVELEDQIEVKVNEKVEAFWNSPVVKKFSDDQTLSGFRAARAWVKRCDPSYDLSIFDSFDPDLVADEVNEKLILTNPLPSDPMPTTSMVFGTSFDRNMVATNNDLPVDKGMEAKVKGD